MHMNDKLKIYADLHNHTTVSDGQLTPEGLVRAAAGSGLNVVGMTDHDTIEGLPAAIEAAGKHPVRLVSGMEITVRFVEALFKGSLHILAYFDASLLGNEGFKEETFRILFQGRGESLTKDRISAINQWFGPEGDTPILPRTLEEADVYRHGSRISRRHFALALADLGVTDRVSEIIGNNSPAYVPAGVPLEYLQEYFSRWPLVRIFAHPAAGSFPGESHYKEVLPPLDIVERIIPRFIALGLDGFEIEYPGHLPEHKERLRNLMKEFNLTVVTGGSDCHDINTRPLGVAGLTFDEFTVFDDCLRTKTREWESMQIGDRKK